VEITSIESLPLRVSTDFSVMTLFLVRLTTNDGLVGYGESCDSFGVSYPGVLANIVDDILAPTMLGLDISAARLALDASQARVRRTLGNRTSVAQARSALHIALTDLAAQAAGASISANGRVRDSVEIYAGNSHFLESRDAAGHRELLAPLLEKGVTKFKMRIGADWRKAMRVLADLRTQLDDPIDLMVDGSELFSIAESLEMASILQSLRISWFEEPVDSGRFGAIAQVARASAVPIAYGEHFSAPEYAMDAMELSAISVIQPDASICGGIEAAREMAVAALGRGARVVMHLHGSPVSFAANLHVAATVPEVDLIEYPFHFSPAHNRLAPSAGFGIDAIVDGRIAIPTGIGLGVELDHRAIEEAHAAWK
jgi:L-alanine-DL-glutamate epimerase-like enolase superfamily enzyme